RTKYASRTRSPYAVAGAGTSVRASVRTSSVKAGHSLWSRFLVAKDEVRAHFAGPETKLGQRLTGPFGMSAYFQNENAGAGAAARTGARGGRGGRVRRGGPGRPASRRRARSLPVLRCPFSGEPPPAAGHRMIAPPPRPGRTTRRIPLPMTEDVPGYRVLEQVGEGGFSVVYRARQEHLDRTVARAWLRQLDPPATREMEDAALRAVARLDGTPFPSTSRLATRWLRGRVPIRRPAGRDPDLETAFCAEIVAVTYQAMGLLPKGRR